MKNKSSVRALFRFIAPDWVLYIFGIMIYSLQGYVYSCCLGLLTSWITEAMLNGGREAITHAVIRFLLLFLLVAVLTAFGIYSLFMTRFAAEGRLKHQVLSGFLCAGIENNNRYEAGVSALNKEVGRAAELYDNATADILGCFFSVSLSLVTMIFISWKLGLLSVLIGVIAFVHNTFFIRPRRQVEDNRFFINRRLIRLITNITQKMPSIRAYHGEKKVECEFEKGNLALFGTYVQESRIDLKQNLAGGIQNLFVILCVWGAGSYLVAKGELSFPRLVIAPFMASALTNGISGISSAFSYIQGPLVACKNLEPFLRTKTEDQKPARYSDWSQWNGDATIQINNLFFCHSGNEIPVLNGISLQINRNRTVAIVGKSGSGKSTLLRTITGLYARDTLPIRLGNISYDDMSPSVWKEKFAYVGQTISLFHMTIAENICMGSGGYGTIEQVEEAARAVGADQFICSLPDGYNTICGEDGVILSGGQKKLVAFAMAMIRKAPVLILDEPTAALDEKSASIIQAVLDRIRGKQTILFATHDLRLARTADIIVVMSEGCIVQMGSHDNLICDEGEYRELCFLEG